MRDPIVALRLAYLIQAERLGRRRLAERIGLGEMQVRLELDELRNRGLIRWDRTGCALTEQGLRTFSSVLSLVRDVQSLDLHGLKLDRANLAAHLVAHASVPAAWQLRDEAIREGATGLILLIQQNGEWTFAHNQEPLRIQSPKDSDQLDRVFSEANPCDLALVVAGADGTTCAQGLWRAIRAIAQSSETPDGIEKLE